MSLGMVVLIAGVASLVNCVPTRDKANSHVLRYEMDTAFYIPIHFTITPGEIKSQVSPTRTHQVPGDVISRHEGRIYEKEAEEPTYNDEGDPCIEKILKQRPGIEIPPEIIKSLIGGG